MAPLSEGPTIALIGFMGAGKTRAGSAIASVLGESWADSDAEIEREIGEPITSFFEREGEERFREVEERVVLELLGRGGVVSLGGGAVESPAVRAALMESYACWCRIDESLAWDRASRDGERPLANDRSAFGRRLAVREPLYEEVSRAILDSGGEETGLRAAHWIRAAANGGQHVAWATSASGSYPAVVGPGALKLLAAGTAITAQNGSSDRRPGRWFAVADAQAIAAHPGALEGAEHVIEVAGGEGSKTLSEAERVLRELARLGARRDDGIIAFGGGVIGDLAGFCAATYQRGIPVIQAPTTLVAQVDSAYGGKTGVDLPGAKNYAGAYHMPSAVLADPGYLETLPERELAAGFAEVVKTALLAGGQLWEKVRGFDRLNSGELAGVVFDCALTKIDVVAADERDSGARQQLNLGHTVGHGIEAAAGFERYRHGEAISLGLLAALRLSGAEDLRAEVAALLARAGLPTTLAPEVETDEVMQAVSRDKKRTSRGIGFVLLETPGEPKVGQAVDEAMVRSAVEELR
ncbi:hypothetical protein BH10ACT11_BH10ACT11_02670 [soil metagenome]